MNVRDSRRALVVVFLVLVEILSLDARPMIGLAVSADVGLAPLVALNNDGVGLHVLVPLRGTLTLESTTSVGFALIVHGVYSTSTYPPDPGVVSHPWFHTAQELGLGIAVALGEGPARTYALRLRPLCLSATWAPFYYVLFGAGVAVDLEIRNKRTGTMVRPVGLYFRANYRPTVLAYRVLFQTGLRYTMTW